MGAALDHMMPSIACTDRQELAFVDTSLGCARVGPGPRYGKGTTHGRLAKVGTGAQTVENRARYAS